jgi:hypothetical protein
MAIRHVPLVQLLRQVVMGWIRHSSTCCQVRVASVATSHHVRRLRPSLSRGPGAGKAYLLLEAPGCVSLEAQALPRVEGVGGTGGQVVKSRLLVPIIW